MSEKIDSYKKILDIYPTLSKQHKKIADYIISNFDEVISQPISNTALTTGVSKPTLVRFSRLLGFSGYPDFRQNMLNMYKESMAPAKRLERYLNDFKEKSTIYDTMVTKEIEYLKQAILTISEKDLLKAVDILCKANTVYCYGAGPNKSIIEYLTFRLNRFGFKTSKISETGRYVFDKLQVITPQDVIVLYKFHKPSDNYSRVVEYLRKNHIPSILITDAKIFHMIKDIDVVLYAKRGPFGVFLSPIIPLSITNALIIGTAKKLGDKVIKNLNELNELLSENSFSELSDLSSGYLNDHENYEDMES